MIAAELSLRNLTTGLNGLSDEIDRKVDVQDKIIPSYLAVTAFIDFAHRFKLVASALPFLNKGKPEFRRLLEALKPIEDARHYLQHIDRELSTNNPVDYPLLGSLAWIKNDICYATILSQDAFKPNSFLTSQRK